MIGIDEVMKNSLAERYGLHAGDMILSINGEQVIDNIDYQALTATKHVCMRIRKEDGTEREVDVIKPISSSLGIVLSNKALSAPRVCANECVFCFVDQMPPGMRPSLYLKDDDWRYSLMMGNFITLTNVGDLEFQRILKRKPSPLYISVHATDSVVRTQLLKNKNAGQLLERLERLKKAGISFHCQVVLCPGLNDGAVLRKTLDDLMCLRPAALSVALVPVGLTRFRKDLPCLKPYNKAQAEDVISICEEYQQVSMEESEICFAYAADEFYSIAQKNVPTEERYDGYPQLENGIGMLRLFEEQLKEAYDNLPHLAEKPRTVCIPSGTSSAPYMKKWMEAYCPDNVKVLLVPIINHYFGETVTVTGLLTATDLLKQLQGIEADEVFIVSTMLNEENELFLDDISFKEFSDQLGLPTLIVPNDGEAFYKALIKITGGSL